MQSISLCIDIFSHLKVDVPDFNAFDEMICDSCTLNNEFLNYYSEFCIQSEETTTTTVPNDSDAIPSTDETNVIESNNPTLAATEPNRIKRNEISVNQANDEHCNERMADNGDVEYSPDSKKLKLNEASASSPNEIVCVRPKTVQRRFNGASFWTVEWRSKLCQCTVCMEEYAKTGVEYLVDEDDTVHAYKEKGRAKAANNPNSLHEQNMHELAGMDHVSKIETIMAYNQIKQKITNYITTLVTNQ